MKDKLITQLFDAALEKNESENTLELYKNFAELIIQECMTIFDSIDDLEVDAWDRGYNQGIKTAKTIIKKKFDVK